jgi:hypothetical protein
MKDLQMVSLQQILASLDADMQGKISRPGSAWSSYIGRFVPHAVTKARDSLQAR